MVFFGYVSHCGSSKLRAAQLALIVEAEEKRKVCVRCLGRWVASFLKTCELGRQNQTSEVRGQSLL